MEESINVFRDIDNGYELVGKLVVDPTIEMTANQFRFVYDAAYLRSRDAGEISNSLPLQDEMFSERQTAAFFWNLVPEGARVEAIAHARHLHPSDFVRILLSLKDEGAGAVMLGTSTKELNGNASYEPLPFDRLVEFAHRPASTAMRLNLEARLSLAGAQEKIGLFHVGDDLEQGWFIPRGSAPSNVIVKACSGEYPAQTVNEHWCMATLGVVFGEDAARTQLLRMPDAEPLLVVERFDRVEGEGRQIKGMRAPKRLHQEDMCQAMGKLPWSKYEPTDGRYIERCAAVVERLSKDRFSDKLLLLQSVVADYALGNADNHLKNRSIIWSDDWSSRSLAPLYDVTCTVAYDELTRVMGMSVSERRSWEDATEEDVVSMAMRLGYDRDFAKEHIAVIMEEVDSAKDHVAFELAKQGFAQAESFAVRLDEKRESLRTVPARRISRSEPER